MTDLTLITGFLGSGKTTLLRQLLNRADRRRYIVLVNEFSTVDVDGLAVQEAAASLGRGDAVTPIPGGSIFCHCLVGTFIDQLQRAADMADAAATDGEPFDGVLVEASGMADPAVTAELLRDTKLDRRLTLRHVVAMVDPGTFPKLMHTLPNIRTQVRAATIIVINKADRFDTESVDAIAGQVRELNPDAALLRTDHGKGVADLLARDARLPVDVHGELAKCRDPNYAVVNLEADELTSFAELAALLREQADAIYRAKGTLIDDTGESHAIDLAGADLADVSFAQPDRAVASGQLVMIVAGASAGAFPAKQTT